MSQNDTSFNQIKVVPEDFNKKSPIEKNYDLMRRTPDPRFGEISIIQKKNTGELVMLKEKVTNSEKEAKVDLLQAKKRLQLQHPYIQKMLDYSCHQRSEFCSKFYKIRGFYELPSNDLKKEISYRKKNMQEFDHEELTHMAYQILSALDYLQSKGTSFGDLKPNHISVENENHVYKLLDRLNDPSPVVQAQMNNILAGRPLYCSPSVFGAVKGNKKKVNHDPHKSDCFSLGMCLLEAGTLENVQDVYNQRNGSINEDKLDQHIGTFRAKYEEDNALLCDLTENLLTVEEAKRFNPRQFNDELPSYEEIQEHFRSNPPGAEGGGSYENSPNRQSQAQPGQGYGPGGPGQGGFNAPPPNYRQGPPQENYQQPDPYGQHQQQMAPPQHQQHGQYHQQPPIQHQQQPPQQQHPGYPPIPQNNPYGQPAAGYGPGGIQAPPQSYEQPPQQYQQPPAGYPPHKQQNVGMRYEPHQQPPQYKQAPPQQYQAPPQYQQHAQPLTQRPPQQQYQQPPQYPPQQQQQPPQPTQPAQPAPQKPPQPQAQGISNFPPPEAPVQQKPPQQLRQPQAPQQPPQQPPQRPPQPQQTQPKYLQNPQAGQPAYTRPSQITTNYTNSTQPRVIYQNQQGIATNPQGRVVYQGNKPVYTATTAQPTTGKPTRSYASAKPDFTWNGPIVSAPSTTSTTSYQPTRVVGEPRVIYQNQQGQIIRQPGQSYAPSVTNTTTTTTSSTRFGTTTAPGGTTGAVIRNGQVTYAGNPQVIRRPPIQGGYANPGANGRISSTSNLITAQGARLAQGDDKKTIRYVGDGQPHLGVGKPGVRLQSGNRISQATSAQPGAQPTGAIVEAPKQAQQQYLPQAGQQGHAGGQPAQPGQPTPQVGGQPQQ